MSWCGRHSARLERWLRRLFRFGTQRSEERQRRPGRCGLIDVTRVHRLIAVAQANATAVRVRGLTRGGYLEQVRGPRRPYIPRFFARERRQISERRRTRGWEYEVRGRARLAGRSSDRWSRLRRVLAPKFPAERDRASDPLPMVPDQSGRSLHGAAAGGLLTPGRQRRRAWWLARLLALDRSVVGFLRAHSLRRPLTARGNDAITESAPKIGSASPLHSAFLRARASANIGAAKDSGVGV